VDTSLRRERVAARHLETVTATTDILIVGAGPTGLALAAQLNAFGVKARIVDRQLDPVHESRALVMQPRTLEALRGLGFAETLVERGKDAVQLRLHFGRRVVALRLFDTGLDDTAYPFLLFISQAETEALLNQHLAAQDVSIERGLELIAFSQDATAITCTLRRRDGTTEQLKARYLVGCDGAHSTVRQEAAIPFQGDAYPQTFVQSSAPSWPERSTPSAQPSASSRSVTTSSASMPTGSGPTRSWSACGRTLPWRTSRPA
jgi:2-polyprenyl-6-methoxyphenol hydroxylase-like FAD-dependent oxidoreductase